MHVSSSAARAEAPILSELPPQDRLRVLTAATEVFTTHGYAGTTLAHLYAQIDPTAFELLFEDAEDRFLQVYDALVDQAAGLISDALSADSAWPERLADALSAVFDLIAANASSARLVLVEARAATPTVMAHHLATLDALSRFMHEGRSFSDNDIPPIVDTVIPAGVAHLLSARLYARPTDPIDDLYPEMLRILLLPYLGDAGTTAFLSTRPI